MYICARGIEPIVNSHVYVC